MKLIIGKSFKNSCGEEYGIIREAIAPFPEEISNNEIFAEDGCGNYFLLISNKVYFWNHETSHNEILANSIDDFILGCSTPTEVELKPENVVSAWIDPEFAKKIMLRNNPNKTSKKTFD